MNFKKFEIYGNPTLQQGSWERTGEGNAYIQYVSTYNPNYDYRICTLDYIPQHHPNHITITGVANNELEASVLVLRSDNYIISALGWQDNGTTFNIGSTYDKIGVMFRFKNGDEISPNHVSFGIVGDWNDIPCYIYTTATEVVENPLYSDGTAITAYTIKGNTVQNGTPTPSNPVDVVGVGERTENLFDMFDIVGKVPSINTGELVNYAGSTCTPIAIQDGNITITVTNLSVTVYLLLYDVNMSYIRYLRIDDSDPHYGTAITGYANAKYCRVRIESTSESELRNVKVMLNEGSTAKPYEPYGYKIPISNGQQTTNIYLGSTQTVRQIEKITFDGSDDEGWYLERVNSYGIANFRLSNAVRSLKSGGLYWLSNRFVSQSSLIAQTETEGILLNVELKCYIRINSTTASTQTAFKQWLSENPVDLYYVLATAETVTVNEPLMKIGTYADTLNNATSIPTTEGANNITVDTTVQPSEFTATWTGWHNANVKEWDGSQWNE